MAKRKVSPEERYHRRLLGELLRSQTVAGETDAETCAALGLDFDAISQAFAPFCTTVKGIETAENFQ